MLPALRNGSFVSPMVGGPVNRLTSLFDRFFHDDFFAPLATTEAVTAAPFSWWEDEHNVYVEMDTPGVSEKDIELAVHEGALIIRGERKCERQEGGYDTRRYGRFERQFHLPVAVDLDHVEARLANGVLRVTLPKRPEARPRKISIKSE